MKISEFVHSFLRTMRTKYDNKNDGTFYGGLIPNDDRTLLNDELVDNFDIYMSAKGNKLEMYCCDKSIFCCVFDTIDAHTMLLCLLVDYSLPKIFMSTLAHNMGSNMSVAYRRTSIMGVLITALLYNDANAVDKLLNTDFESLAATDDFIHEMLCYIPETTYVLKDGGKIVATTVFYSTFEISESFIDTQIEEFSSKSPQCIAILLEYKRTHFRLKEREIGL
jgi:hypothetical protein